MKPIRPIHRYLRRKRIYPPINTDDLTPKMPDADRKLQIYDEIKRQEISCRQDVNKFTCERQAKCNAAIAKLRKECKKHGGHRFEFEARPYGYGPQDGVERCIWCGEIK